MKPQFKNLIITLAAGVSLAGNLRAAQINLVTVGGNATIKLVQDRIPHILTGSALTVNSTNSLIFRYTGTLGGKTVQWDWNLTGGAGAILDIANQHPVTLADNTSSIPVHATTITAPETVNIDPSAFTQDITLVSPVVFVKNAGPNNDLASITNLTQRQAALLESSGGTLPTAFFGGSTNSNNIPANALYFVGRNSSAAVRQVADANIYATGAINYTTNNSGQPILYLDGLGNPSGAGSGSEVVNIVKAIPNSIGTVAAQDIGTLPTLSYEGVPYSTSNIINGTYPVWGYERYIYYTPGTSALAPSNDQLSLIQALEAAVEDPTFQTTSSLFINKFVSYGAVNSNVQRNIHVDGGPITSAIY